jgi:hypothetical protein
MALATNSEMGITVSVMMMEPMIRKAKERKRILLEREIQT